MFTLREIDWAGIGDEGAGTLEDICKEINPNAYDPKQYGLYATKADYEKGRAIMILAHTLDDALEQYRDMYGTGYVYAIDIYPDDGSKVQTFRDELVELK